MDPDFDAPIAKDALCLAGPDPELDGLVRRCLAEWDVYISTLWSEDRMAERMRPALRYDRQFNGWVRYWKACRLGHPDAARLRPEHDSKRDELLSYTEAFCRIQSDADWHIANHRPGVAGLDREYDPELQPAPPSRGFLAGGADDALEISGIVVGGLFNALLAVVGVPLGILLVLRACGAVLSSLGDVIAILLLVTAGALFSVYWWGGLAAGFGGTRRRRTVERVRRYKDGKSTVTYNVTDRWTIRK